MLKTVGSSHCAFSGCGEDVDIAPDLVLALLSRTEKAMAKWYYQDYILSVLE
jgi:hypothetical protein